MGKNMRISEREVRRQKAEDRKNKGENPYAAKFDKTYELKEANELEDGINVSVCGRVKSKRDFGKFTILKLYDINGEMQVSLKIQDFPENFKELIKSIDVGDFIGVTGYIYTSKTNQKTVNSTEVKMLSKSLRPLPEKFHGITDPDVASRERYAEIIMNDHSRNTIKTRINLLSNLRKHLLDNKFVELETPILQNIACGANARPFVTHHNALDEDFYLRIAPELNLKKAVAAGFDRVFEIGKNFRNEGIDASHLQEFTMIEWYAAYWDYLKNMEFSTDLIQKLVGEATGDLIVNYQGQRLDFSKFDKINYIDELSNFLKHNLLDFENVDEIKKLLKENNCFSEKELDNAKSMASIVDLIFKRKIRPSIIQPSIVLDYPSYMVPLARKNDDDPRRLDMFQILVNSWELAKCYSELVDPVIQREEFEKQMMDRANGDEEAMQLDESFLAAMEQGMPPMSGLGMGIDRLVAILSDNPSLRDVILFPPTKQKTKQRTR